MRKKAIADSIRQLRENRNMNQDELGEALGISGKTVSSWEIGRTEPNMGYVEQLADFFCVTTDRLIYGINDSTKLVNIIFDDYFPLRYCTNLSAGTPEELLEAEPDAVVYVPIKYQAMKKRLHAFKVNGTSMNNVIMDGSIVIAEDINHLSSVKDGTIVVAFVDGMATVKRIYTRENQITLMPDSTEKSHLPIMINAEDKLISIIGRVIWHMNPDDIEENY